MQFAVLVDDGEGDSPDAYTPEQVLVYLRNCVEDLKVLEVIKLKKEEPHNVHEQRNMERQEPK